MLLLKLLLVLLLCLAVVGKTNQKKDNSKDGPNPPMNKPASPKQQQDRNKSKPNTDKTTKSSVFDSSPSNRHKAKQNYPHDPVQRRVATVLGDELPLMRDELIQRKNAGEGAVERHVNAWKNKDNWKWHGEEQDRQMKKDAAKK